MDGLVKGGGLRSDKVREILDVAEERRTELTIILAGYKDDMENKLFDFNDGFGRRFNYQITFDDPAAVPPPGPELNWTAKAVVFDGFDKIDVIVSYSLGKEDTITVDGCPYRVLPVEMTLQQFGDDATPVDPEIGRQLYFPDLGTSTYVNYVLPNVSEHDDRPPPRRIYRRP